jgi:tetratricopeptide (TPR) repeat protein
MLLLIVCLVAPGCRKEVRINVTDQDMLRANEASQEGDIAFNRKDYYAALIKYLESVRLNPNNEYVYNRLGIAYSQLKYYEQAGAAFTRSIELNPKYPYSYNNLGSVFFAQKNLKKAEKFFRKALAMKGDEASFHMNMGSLHLEKKRHDKAMEEWRKGLALDPNILSKNTSISLIGGSTSTKERHYFMARLAASAGDVEVAIENLKKAITDGFDDVDLIRTEPDFDKIRTDKRFVEFFDNISLLIKLRNKVGLPEDPK